MTSKVADILFKSSHAAISFANKPASLTAKVLAETAPALVRTGLRELADAQGAIGPDACGKPVDPGCSVPSAKGSSWAISSPRLFAVAKVAFGLFLLVGALGFLAYLSTMTERNAQLPEW